MYMRMCMRMCRVRARFKVRVKVRVKVATFVVPNRSSTHMPRGESRVGVGAPDR